MSRTIEDQLIRAEHQLASVDRKPADANAQLADSHRKGLAPGRPFANQASSISEDVNSKLADLARRYRHLQYDPETGISKLDTDVLFPSGDTQIKGEAERVLERICADHAATRCQASEGDGRGPY